MRIYGYLRASTDQQNASRAKSELVEFAQNQGQTVSAWFIENESGAKLQRPELFRLLEIAESGDVLLVEQVSRISRLNAEDWEALKSIILSKGILIVSLDLPTSAQLLNSATDEFTQRMLSALNAMWLDMLAAVARKDYMDRRKQQKQGIKTAREAGKYRGRRANEKLHSQILELLADGKSYTKISEMLGCSRGTISKVKNHPNYH